MMRDSQFRRSELAAALGGALIVQLGFIAAMTYMSSKVDSDVLPPEPTEERIAVLPILDETRILKLGAKRDKQKLPDMWVKRAPVKRYEEKSAPSETAGKTKEDITEVETARNKDEIPPEDAELVKEADESQPDSDEKPNEANVDAEGSADGSKLGTETDPLKAHAISMYREQIIMWFNQRFSVPDGKFPCSVLQNLKATANINVGGDRTVAGAQLRSSGNAEYDAVVQRTLDKLRGQSLPPPPKNYPDILGSVQVITFSGKLQPCIKSAPSANPAPSESAPAPAESAPAPTESAPAPAPAPSPESGG